MVSQDEKFFMQFLPEFARIEGFQMSFFLINFHAKFRFEIIALDK